MSETPAASWTRTITGPARPGPARPGSAERGVAEQTPFGAVLGEQDRCGAAEPVGRELIGGQAERRGVVGEALAL